MTQIGDIEAMRRDWDERAANDVFHYIATWQKKWDSETFFRSGERDYLALVEPVLVRLGFEPCHKRMLEVGCGVGRMTRSFARRFKRIYALDVSAEMLRRARALHGGANNILWLLGNGADFSMLKSGSLDLVFTYIVLHHIPTTELALSYIREMLRILKKGGVFLFQFNSRRRPTMNWRGRLVWSVIDRLREPFLGIRLGKLGHNLAALLSLDPLAAGKTWRGAVLDVREVFETVWECGGSVSGCEGWGTQMTWCYGCKVHEEV